jgi:hypothetical protein
MRADAARVLSTTRFMVMLGSLGSVTAGPTRLRGVIGKRKETQTQRDAEGKNPANGCKDGEALVQERAKEANNKLKENW